MGMSLVDYLEETIDAVCAQLKDDEARWGDTWRKRTKDKDEQGRTQEDRIFSRLFDYYDQYKNAGVPINWLKVIGLAHIALVRENHPEELEAGK